MRLTPLSPHLSTFFFSSDIAKLELWRANQTTWDLSKLESELLLSLQRLGVHAPVANTSHSRDIIRALCAGFPMIDDAALAEVIGGLTEEARVKYNIAMNLGPLQIVREVEDAIRGIVCMQSIV